MVESRKSSAAASSYRALTQSQPSLTPVPILRPARFASCAYVSLFRSYSSRVGAVRRLSLALVFAAAVDSRVLAFTAARFALAFVFVLAVLAFSLLALLQPVSRITVRTSMAPKILMVGMSISLFSQQSRVPIEYGCAIPRFNRRHTRTRGRKSLWEETISQP